MLGCPSRFQIAMASGLVLILRNEVITPEIFIGDHKKIFAKVKWSFKVFFFPAIFDANKNKPFPMITRANRQVTIQQNRPGYLRR